MATRKATKAMGKAYRRKSVRIKSRVLGKAHRRKARRTKTTLNAPIPREPRPPRRKPRAFGRAFRVIKSA